GREACFLCRGWWGWGGGGRAAGGKDGKFVAPPGGGRPPAVGHWRELDPSRVQRLALGPLVGCLGGAFRVLGGVRECKDDGPVVEARHRFDDRPGEGVAHRADAHDRRRLDGFDGGDEIPARRVRVGVRLLKVEQVLAARLQEAVDVEHRDAGLRVFKGKAFLHHGGGDQAGKADRGRTGAEEEDALIANLAAGDLEGGDQSGERHAARALNIVVVAAHLVTVARQEVDRVAASPVLEVDAAVWKYLLH